LLFPPANPAAYSICEKNSADNMPDEINLPEIFKISIFPFPKSKTNVKITMEVQ
jgi:hypothetical protein